jgi:hypothetical protein
VTGRLIDFGDDEQWHDSLRDQQLALPIDLPDDREHRLVPDPPPVTRRHPIERIETKEELL